MQPIKLLSYNCKITGWILFFLFSLAGVLKLIFNYSADFLEIKIIALVNQGLFGDLDFFVIQNNNVFDEILTSGFLISLLLVVFSKDKNESEYTNHLRLKSFFWAIIANSIFLLCGVIFVYGIAYFWILIANIISLFVFYLIRFIWLKIKNKSQKKIP